MRRKIGYADGRFPAAMAPILLLPGCAFPLGQSGEADKAPRGNSDGRVTLDKLDRYLKDTLTYYARRYYGRDQTAQIIRSGGAP